MPTPAYRREAADDIGNGQRFSELDVVRLRVGVPAPGGVLQPGATGTVVHVHRGGEAYLVEFAEPAGFVATLPAQVLELAG